MTSLVEQERRAGDLLYRLFQQDDSAWPAILQVVAQIAESNPDICKSSMYMRGKQCVTFSAVAAAQQQERRLFYLLLVLSSETALQEYFLQQSNPKHPGNVFGKPEQLKSYFVRLADMRELTLNFACNRTNIQTVVRNFVVDAKKYYIGVH